MRNKTEQAYAYLKATLLIKSMKAWQHMMPEMKQKNRLLKILQLDRNAKIQAKVFKALAVYKNFRFEKKAVDYMMMKNV